jgi:hypothetical protein
MYLYTASQEMHVSYMFAECNQLSREGVFQRRVSHGTNHGYSVHVNNVPYLSEVTMSWKEHVINYTLFLGPPKLV